VLKEYCFSRYLKVTFGDREGGKKTALERKNVHIFEANFVRVHHYEQYYTFGPCASYIVEGLVKFLL